MIPSSESPQHCPQARICENRGKRRPRYLALADDLADDFGSGRYPAGSMLLRETEVCERFDGSRFTVREAQAL